LGGSYRLLGGSDSRDRSLDRLDGFDAFFGGLKLSIQPLLLNDPAIA
jgi:hypothetical protein